MVTEPVPGLDDHKVEAQWQERQDESVGKRAELQEAVGRGAYADPLPGIDGFLRQAEAATRAHAHLNDHQHSGRTGINGYEVQFVSPDADVPAQD